MIGRGKKGACLLLSSASDRLISQLLLLPCELLTSFVSSSPFEVSFDSLALAIFYGVINFLFLGMAGIFVGVRLTD